MVSLRPQILPSPASRAWYDFETVWPNKCYFIRLIGTKEGQECEISISIILIEEEIKKGKRDTGGIREADMEHM